MRSNVEKTVSDKVERQSSHELLDLYLRRLEADPELQPEAFLKQFPEVSAEVSGLLSAVRGLHLASKASEDAQPLSNLSQLGDFKLEGIIGRGGMGLVFQAHQISLDRKVALKVLAASAAIDPINRQRFQLEARAAASLQHPNIVQIYAVGTESQVDYYAMQFIEGSSIADILDGVKQPQKAMSAAWFGGDHAERTTSEEHASATDAASDRERAASPPMMRGHAFAPLQAAEIAGAVAEALSAAHLNGIIHRDVKPSNIMLDVDGKPYVTDFGLAHVEQDLQLTMPGTVLGSLRYMSPEQLEPQRQTIDARCDIYGLGATLYEMLTLRPAVAGKERKQVLNNLLQGEILSPRRFNPQIPKDLETIVLKALEPDRKDRYASAADMASDLRAFLEHRPIAAQPNSLFRQVIAWGRRNPIVAALSLALLLLLIVTSLSATLVAYRMNRLAEERAGLLQQAETERASAEALADFLIKAFRSPDPSMDGRKFTVAEMLDSASEELLTDKTLDEVAQGDLLDAIGQSLRGLGAFEEAERVHQACFELRKQVLGPSSMPALQSMTRLALAKRDLSNLSDSIALYEEALGLLRQHYGDDDPNTLEAIGALAMAYQDDAQLEKAAPLQKESLERRKRVLGEKDPATLQAMNNMGLWLQENNRHEEACEIYQQAYRLRAEVLTKRHPDTLQSMANLSGALQDLGRLEEAIKLQEESLQLHREVLGEKHPNTLISMNNTALLYADLDRMDECVELFEEVLSSMREKLSDTHQDTLITMGNLAYFYHLAGRMDKAIALAEERLAGETQNRGAEHVVVASSHSMLGTFHFANKNYAKAEGHLQASLAIRRAQGIDDWTTYRDQNKLGEILVATQKYQEAEPLLLKSHQQLVAQSEQIPAMARERILAESAARLVAYFEAVDLPEQAEEYRQTAVQKDSQ